MVAGMLSAPPNTSVATSFSSSSSFAATAARISAAPRGLRGYDGDRSRAQNEVPRSLDEPGQGGEVHRAPLGRIHTRSRELGRLCREAGVGVDNLLGDTFERLHFAIACCLVVDAWSVDRAAIEKTPLVTHRVVEEGAQNARECRRPDRTRRERLQLPERRLPVGGRPRGEQRPDDRRVKGRVAGIVQARSPPARTALAGPTKPRSSRRGASPGRGRRRGHLRVGQAPLFESGLAVPACRPARTRRRDDARLTAQLRPRSAAPRSPRVLCRYRDPLRTRQSRVNPRQGPHRRAGRRTRPPVGER